MWAKPVYKCPVCAVEWRTQRGVGKCFGSHMKWLIPQHDAWYCTTCQCLYRGDNAQAVADSCCGGVLNHD